MHAALFKGAVQLILITKNKAICTQMVTHCGAIWRYGTIWANTITMYSPALAIMLLASYMEGENTVN